MLFLHAVVYHGTILSQNDMIYNFIQSRRHAAKSSVLQCFVQFCNDCLKLSTEGDIQYDSYGLTVQYSMAQEECAQSLIFEVFS